MTALLDGPLLAPPLPRLRPARLAPAPPSRAPAPPPPRVPCLPEHPDVGTTVTRLLRLACEVLDGRRAPAHLAVHAEPPVLRYWRAAAGPRRHTRPARFGRVHLHHPRAGATEVAVVLEADGRARALAARFDLVDGRWRWTAVRLG